MKMLCESVYRVEPGHENVVRERLQGGAWSRKCCARASTVWSLIMKMFCESVYRAELDHENVVRDRLQGGA